MSQAFRRAVWLDIGGEIHSPEAAAEFVAWCGRAGVDLAFPCVNHCTGCVTYPSDLAPRSVLTDRWDLTAEVARRCREAGIESHVWVCIGNWGPPRIDPALRSARGPRFLSETHPEWYCADQNGVSMLDLRCDYAFLNLARAEVREFQVKLCQEILERYPFEGYHLDYIRFHFKPSQQPVRKKEAFDGRGEAVHAVPLEGSERLSFDSQTLEAFQKESGLDFFGAGKNLAERVQWLYADLERRETWYAWKSSKVTELVRELRKTTAGLGRKLSAALFSGYPWCGKEVSQRWPAWVDERLLDLAVPMDYEVEPEEYAAHLESQFGHLRHGPKPATPMLSGLSVAGSWRSLPVAELSAKIARMEEIAQAHHRCGVCFFNYGSARRFLK